MYNSKLEVKIKLDVIKLGFGYLVKEPGLPLYSAILFREKNSQILVGIIDLFEKYFQGHKNS